MSETVVIFRRTGTVRYSPSYLNYPPTRRPLLHCLPAHRSALRADYDLCVSRSDPAAPAEYRDLFEELERRGYDLTVRRRTTPDMHERRRRLATERRCRSAGRRLRGPGHERLDRSSCIGGIERFDTQTARIRAEDERAGRA